MGSKTTLMVRPEEFVVTPLGEASDGIVGVVKGSEFRGSQTLLRIEVPGMSVVITALAPPLLVLIPEGTKVVVQLVDNFTRCAQI